MKRQSIALLALVVIGFAIGVTASRSLPPLSSVLAAKNTPTHTSTATATIVVEDTLTPTVTPSATPIVTVTSIVTSTSEATVTPTPNSVVEPYPEAPLCPDSGLLHNYIEFHTIWDSMRGCHYDHEHGTNPFTPEMDAILPGIESFLGGVQIGSTNPSSPIENVLKHGGEKWDAIISNPHGCLAGFEGAEWCVKAAAIQYHNFGNYAVEFNARIHSAEGFLLVCDPANPSDCGTLYTSQLEDYGQRVTPYQGTVLPYPDNFFPEYVSPRGPYFTIDCVYLELTGCRSTLSFIRDRNLNTNSIWTSKPTGFPGEPRPASSTILKLLFRVRDTYQVLDSRDLVYPFTFPFVCSSDGGVTYNPIGCKYNNSTTAIHEVSGIIPASWDNLVDFDTNPEVGRITAEGYTDRFGTLVLPLDCTIPSDDCFPIKMENMFIGSYGDFLTLIKTSNTTITSNPPRNIYFCGGVVCAETAPGAIASGWIGPEN